MVDSMILNTTIHKTLLVAVVCRAVDGMINPLLIPDEFVVAKDNTGNVFAEPNAKPTENGWIADIPVC